MPEEIKAIVRHLLAEYAVISTGWEGVAAHDWDKGNFDKLFEWLKAEAEKPLPAPPRDPDTRACIR